MRLSWTVALAGCSSLSSVLAKPLANLEPRSGCNADNCLRAIRATGSDPAIASSYCKSYLSSVPGTVTVTKYTSFTTTATPSTVTELTGVTTTTEEIECTSTSYISIYLTTVTTTSAPVVPKRAATTPFATLAASACPSANGIKQAARISSACSCFLTSGTATATISITSTLPAPTATITTGFADIETETTCTSTAAATETLTFDFPQTIVANGKTFFAEGGSIFAAYGDWYDEKISTKQPSMLACVEHCATRNSCAGLSYNEDTGDCMTLKGFVYGTGPNQYLGYDRARWLKQV